MEFIDQDIHNYIESHTTDESAVLKELERETYAKVLMPRMLSGHLMGRTLSMLSKLIRPEIILEVGTFTGYSAICLAEGLADAGKLITIDNNEELEDFARKYIKKAGFDQKVEQILGNAKDVISELDIKIDIVFLDADKENYPTYYDLLFPLLKLGGYIIADNVLWSGKVVDLEQNDQATKQLRVFNDRVNQDERVENIMLPIRDGISLIKKVKE